MRPEDCPKYPTCNASICPIDPLWPSAAHLPGEKVCPYLLASGKAGAETRFTGAEAEVFRAALVQLPLVTAKHTDIRKRVEVAARSGFKGIHAGTFKPRGAAAGGDSGCPGSVAEAEKAV